MVGLDSLFFFFSRKHDVTCLIKAKGGSTVVNMNVNTVLTALLSQEWETLLRRLVVFICMLAFTFIISLSLSLSLSELALR